MFFKILNGDENIGPDVFLRINTTESTTGHNFTILNGQSRLDVRKYSFSQSTVNEWNKLSTDCLHSSNSNTNMFKKTDQNRYLWNHDGGKKNSRREISFTMKLGNRIL